MRVKKESEKAGLKLNSQKTWSWHPVPSLQGKGEKVDTVTDFIFLGSKITVDGNCSHKNKRRFLPGRKAMTNVDSLKKQRHHFANKGAYSQSYSFSSSHVRMWELVHNEGWVPKNWCFQIVVLEKTLESPCIARRSNQSILNEINPEYSFEALTLKLQYFGHLMCRADSWKRPWCWERSRAGEGGNRGWDGWVASLT